MKLATHRLLSLSVFVTTLFVSLTLSHAQDWPQFRGADGSASATDANTPTTWSDQENIAWKTKLPGRGSSSPIVVGDRVLLCAFTGYGQTTDPNGEAGNKSDLRLHTLCFDRQTGSLIWDRSINASPNEQEFSKRVADHGYTSGTPASDGKSVFAFFGVSGAVAYDLDGNPLWHNKDLGSKTAGFGSSSSPVVNDNLVYINASIEGGTLYALNKTSGEVVWQKDNIDKCWSSVCIAETESGDRELVINQKETVYGLDPNTGQQLWSCAGIQDYVVPVPIARDGVIYCLGGRSNRALAIKLGGRGDVTATHKLWETNVGANVTSPVLVGDYLYWASDKGIANCMNAKTGEPVFRERMPTRERVYASIVHAGDKLYLTTRDRGVQVLAAKPEFEQLALNVIESDPNLFNASPAVSGNQLFLRSDAYLYCISEQAN